MAIDPILDLDIGIRCDDEVLGVCVEIPDRAVRVRVGLNETADVTLEGREDLDCDEELRAGRRLRWRGRCPRGRGQPLPAAPLRRDRPVRVARGRPALAGPRAGLQGTDALLWELAGCLTGTVGVDSVDVLDLQHDSELFDLCTTFAD